VRFAKDLPDGSPFAARDALAGKDARTLARELLGMSPDEFSTAFRGSPTIASWGCRAACAQVRPPIVGCGRYHVGLTSVAPGRQLHLAAVRRFCRVRAAARCAESTV
jgi:hypothetical protein